MSHPNAELIERFHRAFDTAMARRWLTCYAPDVASPTRSGPPRRSRGGDVEEPLKRQVFEVFDSTSATTG